MNPGPSHPEIGAPSPHVTRLAPSPTGALHLGNARTFLVTWALARQRGWRIVMRVEDLDTPRVKPGAAGELAAMFRWLGIDWDPWPAAGPDGVLVQSGDLEPYCAAMRALAAAGLAYPCRLTRAQIEAAASAPQEGAHDVPFPAGLRPPHAGARLDFDAVQSAAAANGGEEANWRFLCPAGAVRFRDEFAGEQRFDPSAVVGDFVLWTKRDQPSYQLAVVVDDHRQGVDRVVRGDDLLDSAARQLLLYRALGLSHAGVGEPTYTHLPLVIGTDGRRLAKRHGDTRVDAYRAMGVPPEAVVGLAGLWSGATAGRRCQAADEFRAALDLATMPRTPIMFTPEDHAWLVSQAR